MSNTKSDAGLMQKMLVLDKENTMLRKYNAMLIRYGTKCSKIIDATPITNNVNVLNSQSLYTNSRGSINIPFITEVSGEADFERRLYHIAVEFAGTKDTYHIKYAADLEMLLSIDSIESTIHNIFNFIAAQLIKHLLEGDIVNNKKEELNNAE